MHHQTSIFKNLPLEHRTIEAKKFLKLMDKSVNWKKEVVSYEAKFIEITTSLAVKMLAKWERRLQERDDHMDTLDYGDPEEEERKEKLLKNTKSIWADYEKALASVAEEQEIKTVGDIKESAQEKGLFN